MYNANCIRENQISQIERYGKCATITHGGSKELQWERCMQKMSKQLARTCHGLGKVASGNSPGEEMTGKLKQASDIFFCEKGGNLTCCFSNVQCLEDWHELNDKVKQALFWQITKKIQKK